MDHDAWRFLIEVLNCTSAHDCEKARTRTCRCAFIRGGEREAGSRVSTGRRQTGFSHPFPTPSRCFSHFAAGTRAPTASPPRGPTGRLRNGMSRFNWDAQDGGNKEIPPHPAPHKGVRKRLGAVSWMHRFPQRARRKERWVEKKRDGDEWRRASVTVRGRQARAPRKRPGPTYARLGQSRDSLKAVKAGGEPPWMC